MQFQGYFYNHKYFISQKNNKVYYVLEFINQQPNIDKDNPKISRNEVVSVFVDENKYNDYLKSHKYLQKQELLVSINGSRVNYSLAD